jgi:tetratricopeptide (TPR) repeat protein
MWNLRFLFAALTLPLWRSALPLAAGRDADGIVYVTAEERPAYEQYNRAVSLQRAGEPALAMAAYLSALAIKEALPQAHMNVAALLERAGQPGKGQSHHRQSARHAPSDAFRSTALTNLAVSMMQYPPAAAGADAAGAEAAGAGEAAAAGAVMSVSGAGYDGAGASVRDLLEAAIGLDPANDNAYFTLSAHCTELKQFDEALKHLDYGLSINPEHAVGLMNKGNHFFRLGEYGPALAWYRRAGALDMQPHDTLLLLNNMGQCLREGGQCAAALVTLRQARSVSGAEDGGGG